MRFNGDLINAHNAIGGAPGDIVAFCEAREPRSLEALYLRHCTDPVLLRMATELLKTGGVLAIRFSGGSSALASRTAVDRMLSAVFNSRWTQYFCRHDDVVWTRVCRLEDASYINWKEPLFDHYLDLLRQGIPFSYLRYNDGEWICALETLLSGFGYQEFTKDLRREIQISLVDYYRDPHYFMSMPRREFFTGAIRQWELIAAYLRENGISNMEWVDAGAFNGTSETGNLWPFIQHLQKNNTIIVGPAKLRPLNELFPKATFVTIPDTQCHAASRTIQNLILAQDHPAIILFTAGPACEPLIHQLWPVIGNRSTMIDLGSLWAPYLGKPEHGAHTRMTSEVIARNVGR